MAKSSYVFLPGLKAARIRAGLKRVELAEMIGVSPYTLGNWEQLHKRCSTERLEDIAAALKTNVAVLKESAVATDRHPSKSTYVHALKGLKAARNEVGLLQKELAAKIYMNTQAVIRWERGYRLATDAQLHALADVLGVAPERLLEEPPKPVRTYRDVPAQLTYADIKTEQASRSDMTVSRENHKAYWESKKKPRRCETCGVKLSAYNKGSVWCYRHISPDSRMEYRERMGVAS